MNYPKITDFSTVFYIYIILFNIFYELMAPQGKYNLLELKIHRESVSMA